MLARLFIEEVCAADVDVHKSRTGAEIVTGARVQECVARRGSLKIRSAILPADALPLDPGLPFSRSDSSERRCSGMA